MDVRLFAFLARQPSAALQPRERFCGLPKRALALLLANVMFWQPLWAQAEGLAVSAPGTSLGQAGNGVPIVDIAAPNGSGLSHNRFADYNVAREGLILNNATARTQATQLGGIILGNPNLQGQAASAILNEVTGANPSQLRGYTEVAGQAARVIVANPHGISCDGCGFINTPQVTLSTGKPILDGNGQLRSYQVDGGSIAIEGAGLDASQVDRFELITRSATLNARLHAKQLDIVTGRNDVDAATLQATARANDGSAAPALAIDSSALGGMYAGAIRLVGTERGVGVRLAGDMAASAGDLNIDAAGQLTLGNASAGRDLNIKAGSAELNGNAYAGGSATLRTAGDLTVHQSLAASQQLSIDAAQVRNQGVIEAGVEADQRRNAHADLTLTSKGLVNSGQVVASRDLALTVSDSVVNNGALKGQRQTLVADALDNRKGQVLADSALTVTTRLLDNRETGALSSAGSTTVTARERLDNQAGRVAGAQHLKVTGGEINNGDKGLIATDGQLILDAVQLNNQGGKLSASHQQLKGGGLDNQGGSLVGKTLEARFDQLDNTGGSLVATQGAATVTANQRLANHGGTLQAKTHLQVTGGELLNQGGKLLGASVALDGQRLDNSGKGRVVAETGALNVKVSGAVDNSGGRLQATASAVEVSAASVDNQHGVVVGQQVVKVTATGGTLDNRAGQVLGNRLELTGATLDNRSEGQVLAGSGGLLIQADTVRNQQGKLLAGGSLAELLLGAGRVDNQQGSLTASAITLVAGDADNSGGTLSSLAGNQQLTVQRLVNRNGLVEASDTITLDGQTLDNSQNGRLIAHAGDKTRLTLSGTLDNRGGHIASASTDLQLKADSLLNQGGTLEHVAQGNLQLNAASFTGTQGRVSGLGSGTWTLGSVEGVGTWHTNAGLDISGLRSITLYNGERIASAGNLRLAGVQLTNDGELLSDGKLTLEMTGDLLNRGLFSSLQAMHLQGANLTQAHGRIASAGPMTVKLDGTLSNLGRLTSSQTLEISAGTLDNQGTLGAQGKVTLHASGAIANQQDSLLFAGGPLELRSATLLNRYADIYSKGDLSYAALGGGRAVSLRNLSGSIESEGHVDIKVDTLENAKEIFVAGETMASREIRINCTDCSGDHHTGAYIVATTYKGTVTQDSPAARLLANGNLTLDTVTVDNRQSLLAANGNLTASAQDFYNRGQVLNTRIEEVSHWLRGVSQDAYRVTEAATNEWNARYKALPIEQQAPIPSAVTQYQPEPATSWIKTGTDTAYAGTVQAGGTLALNVSNELVNGTLDAHNTAQLTGKALDSSASGAGGVQITLATQAGDPGTPRDVKRIETLAADGSTLVSFVPVDFSGAPFISVDPTALPSFRLPRGEYGLFVRSQSPASRYLVESNPELTDLGRFMASDYLLGNLGYDPDQAWRRLGDGRYETRLVADAVRAQTGQRFLADGLASDYEQFKYLMDNAVASKDALGLSVGVGLTGQQVAALTHDIVWMEERVVEGQKVLAPVLYLAKVDARNLRGGALVQGRDLQLVTGGDLKSVGTLRASNDLSAVAGGSLYQGGLAQANEHLALMAKDSIRNALAGEIRGNQVDLVALKGDIVNDRTATEVTVGASTLTRVDAGSLIDARGDLAMSAGGDLTNKGRINSAGDLTAQAGGDINLLAVQDHTVSREALRRGLRTEETVTQLGSSLEATGNVTLKAGGDLNVVASHAKAGQRLDASAEGDVNVVAGEDVHNVESRSKQGKKKVHEVDEHSRQVAATLTAGEGLAVKAGNDVNLVASRLKAGDEAYVQAGNDLNLIAAQERDYSLYDMQKKGGWGSKQAQRDEVTRITHVGSQISSGGDLTLVSGGDQLYQVAKLDSGNDINLVSGGAITFEAVKDLHEESHTKSNNNAFWNAAKGKGNTDETLRQTQMQAAGAITIKAVEGLRIDLKQVDQQTVSQAIDAMVAADPQLAWIKAAEQRGDVDWRQVREIHESFKYDTSGLGPASQLIIAIALAAVMGPMMAGMNTMLQAGAISVATKATVSTIDNRGNLGAVFKDVTSSGSLKGYAVSIATAGAAQSLGFDPGAMGFNVESLKTVMLKAAADATIKTAVYGGSFKDNLGSALLSTAASAAGAYAAGKIGDHLPIDGSFEKILLHSALGGLMAEVMGSDFRTGAIAGGANEALVGLLGDKLLPANLTPGTAEYAQAEANLVALSKIVGVLGAAATEGDLDVAAQVAENGTRYNYLLHEEIRNRAKEYKGCKGVEKCELDVLKRYADLDKSRNEDLPGLCKSDPIRCQALMKQLASESGANDALMDSSRHESVNNSFGVLDASESNNEAISTIQSELTRLQYGNGTAFFAQILELVAGVNLAKNVRLGHAKSMAEVSKPTSITKITDEMKANPYHPDWQRYTGNEPRAVGADVVSGGVKEPARLIDGVKVVGAKAPGKDYVDILSPEAKQHILYGDKPGSGGHMWPGQQGKTVFPESWSGEKIVHAVGDITTSPNTKWYAQTGTGGAYTAKGDPAKWVAYETRDGVRMRVVYQPATGKVVTAFPDDAPVPPYKPIR
nr:DUF637 domain-containing protein [Pseudomonas sp. UFMG81]